MSINLDKGGVWNCHACNIGGGIFDFESQLFPTRSNEERWVFIYKITGATPTVPGKYIPRGPVIATYQYVAPDGTLLFEKQRHDMTAHEERILYDESPPPDSLLMSLCPAAPIFTSTSASRRIGHQAPRC